MIHWALKVCCLLIVPAVSHGAPVVSVHPLRGPTLHPEFSLETGSSIRAHLLYPGLVYGTSTKVVDNDSRPADPWVSFDKVEHVTFGFLLTVGTQYMLVNKLGSRERPALPVSVGVAAAAGIGKELYDRRYGSGFFSKRDLVADAAGIVVGVAVILM